MNKQMTQYQNSLWAEVCSDSQDDWNEALKLFARSFANTAPFPTTGLSDEESNGILEEYFKYVYETEMSNERAGLICVKEKNDDGSIAIVYAFCLLHRIEFSAGDRSRMDAIDTNFTDNQISGDAWLNTEIVLKMKKASQDLDIHTMYGTLIACRADRMRTGLGRRFAMKCIDMFYEDGLKRGYFVREKPCIFYDFVDDISALGFQNVLQTVQIAHLHGIGEPICGLADPSLQNSCNCVFVFAKVISGDFDLNAFVPYFKST